MAIRAGQFDPIPFFVSVSIAVLFYFSFVLLNRAKKKKWRKKKTHPKNYWNYSAPNVFWISRYLLLSRAYKHEIFLPFSLFARFRNCGVSATCDEWDSYLQLKIDCSISVTKSIREKMESVSPIDFTKTWFELPNWFGQIWNVSLMLYAGWVM